MTIRIAFGLGLAIFFCVAFRVYAQSPCVTTVQSKDERGAIRLSFESGCRANEKVRVTLGIREQQLRLDDKGSGTIVFIVTEPANRFDVLYQDGSTAEVTAIASGLNDIMRISLLWSAPVNLDLHVLEPRGLIGGKGDATRGRNAVEFNLKGTIDIEDDGSGLGPFRESYLFPGRIAEPESIFSIFVENVTRGRLPESDYCGSGEFAKIELTVIILDRGKVREQPFEMAAAPCGAHLGDQVYFHRLNLR